MGENEMISPIEDFFNGKTVFITGATGFIGKVIIEKLLRCCNRIETIYILIRQKKGQTAAQRADNFLNDPIFSLTNHIDLDDARKKVIPIIGDLSEPGIGICKNDRQSLINDVTIILHCAGDIKFDPTLRYSVNHNVIGLKNVIELANQIKYLNVFVFVSTMCVVTTMGEGKEKIYPLPVSPEHVFETLENFTDDKIKRYEQLFFPEYANSYTIAKSLTEQLILRENGKYNIAIVRPSAVNPAYREPVPGWVDAVHGPIGLCVLASLGFIRVTNFNFSARPGQIPVDMASNAVITAAWYIGTTKPESSDEKHFQIYNITSLAEESPSLFEMINLFRWNVKNAPSNKCLRPVSRFNRGRLSRIQFKIHHLISHWFFAYFVALIGKIIGFKSNIIKVTKSMEKFLKLSAFFTMTYPFENDNARHLIEQMSPYDRRKYDFDVRTIDWEPYYAIIWLGLRRYLFKEKDEDIPMAKKRLKRVILLYYILLMVCINIDTFSIHNFRIPSSMTELLLFVTIPVCVYVGYRISN